MPQLSSLPRRLASCLLILSASLCSASAGSEIIAWGDLGQNFVPPGSTDIVAVAAGHFHNLSLKANGTLTAWPVSQGGSADPASHLPRGLTNIVRMASGVAHDLALRADGTVVAWGDNTYGQTVVPTDLTGAVAITAGGYHSLALTADGSVRAWGDNSYGQCAVPDSATNVVGIAAGFYHSVALLANGTIICWGDDSFGQAEVPVGLTNAIAVSAGGDHCLALTAAGGVIGWGDDSYGQTSVPGDLTNAVAIAAGSYHSLALRADGTVTAWGPLESATAVPAGLTNVLAIAAGGSHSLALVQSGGPMLTLPMTFQTVPSGSSVTLSSGFPESAGLAFQWSLNGTPLTGATRAELTLQNAQTNQTGTYSLVASNAFGLITHTATLVTILPTVILTPPLSQTNFAGSTLSLSVTPVSTLPVSYQWRFNDTNLPGATGRILTLPLVTPDQQGTYSVAVSNFYGTDVSPEANISIIGLVAWNGGRSFAMNLGDVAYLAKNRSGRGLAARVDGTVAGPGLASLAPPANLTNVIAIEDSYQDAVALKADGTVVAWGYNHYGETNVPPDLTNAVAIACGDFHNLALRANGTVAAWGDDSSGATEVPVGLAHVVAIPAGDSSSLAITSDRQLIFWGNIFGANSAVPPGLTGAVAVATGNIHFLALSHDGTVVDWGDVSGGQTDVPVDLTNAVAIAASDDNESLALTARGTVVAWGVDSVAQGKVLASLSNIVAVAAGTGSGNNLALIGSGPPHLSTPLVSRQIAQGATTSFRAVATGLWPLTYQWMFYGTNLPGATNSMLTLSNVQPQQAGAYSVMVSNLSGVTTSEKAQLSVAPVLIDAVVAHPSRLAYAGENVTLSAVAQGLALNYQWLSNGVPIAGATNSILALTNIQLSQAAGYSVAVNNSLGQVTSPTAVMNVVPVWIYYQTLNQTAFPGGSASFSVFAQGSPPLNYQWSFNGKTLPGATNPTLNFATVTPPQSGTYSLTISNLYGVVTSQPANLAVLNVAEWPRGLSNQPSFIAIPSDVTSLAASSAGWCLGLNGDGTVISLPTLSPPVPQIPANLTNAIGIAAGWMHALALKADGTVSAWGDNHLGQTDIPAGLAGVVSIAAAGSHNLALTSDGTVIGWGDNSFGQTNIPPGLTNIVAIAVGTNGSLALSRDGHVSAWGADDSGHPLSTPPDITNLVALAARDSMLLGIRSDGTLAVWSTNPTGPPFVPPGLANLVEIAANPGIDLELAAGGTVASWVMPTNTATAIANIGAVAVGGGTAFALLGSGPTLLPILLDNAVYDTNGFSVPVPTQSGKVYALEYKDSLAENQWKPLPLVAGNGNQVTLRDATAAGASRFYQVRRW